MKMREKNIGEIEGNTKEEGIETKKKKGNYNGKGMRGE